MSVPRVLTAFAAGVAVAGGGVYLADPAHVASLAEPLAVPLVIADRCDGLGDATRAEWEALTSPQVVADITAVCAGVPATEVEASVRLAACFVDRLMTRYEGELGMAPTEAPKE
jgi:hypothetical protein